jgi:hypothetical protein
MGLGDSEIGPKRLGGGQHLVKRDSSVVTGTTAVGLNPDHVREVDWWEHEGFSDRERLEAAELVAFDVFDPALRSRGRVREAAMALAGDAEFAAEMKRLFEGPPAGRLVLPSLVDVAGGSMTSSGAWRSWSAGSTATSGSGPLSRHEPRQAPSCGLVSWPLKVLGLYGRPRPVNDEAIQRGIRREE